MKDQLFNADSLSDLAAEYATAIAGFDGEGFHREVVAGLDGRELLERLEWIADCVAARLAPDFVEMAEQLEAAMPAPLDPGLRDDDFGRFIHAVPGILAVRHGLEAHRERALELLYAATQRFSMEFYIRPFLNRWPEETLARLEAWAGDGNYHVRRLVSEGTRPKLPWAKAITMDPMRALPLLDRLHADPTRYVTRSVANHLNDIAKIDPEAVVARLGEWHQEGRQAQKELDWMTRHALRTLVKQGHAGALELLGYRADAPVRVASFTLVRESVAIGDALEFEVALDADAETPVIVDYVLSFHRPSGKPGRKVFKLKQGVVTDRESLKMRKRHVLKGNATTFRLHPGPHSVAVQVNGRILAERRFDVLDPA
ncbi:DNA alkylation repair protein [Shimia sediminis]|uniref:DNA alkylation repair protein n=1 Tax=Shimia sediminis TaxID=2497945 RepID=UPI0027B959E6|nr:DNA alkylation repair protein [Shimia sediminis]